MAALHTMELMHVIIGILAALSIVTCSSTAVFANRVGHTMGLMHVIIGLLVALLISTSVSTGVLATM